MNAISQEPEEGPLSELDISIPASNPFTVAPNPISPKSAPIVVAWLIAMETAYCLDDQGNIVLTFPDCQEKDDFEMILSAISQSYNAHYDDTDIRHPEFQLKALTGATTKPQEIFQLFLDRNLA